MNFCAVEPLDLGVNGSLSLAFFIHDVINHKHHMYWQVILFVILVTSLTSLGGWWIAQKEAKALFAWLPLFIAFGTGLLLAMAVTEFTPHSFAEPSPWTPLWMLFGILLVVFSDKYLAPLLGPDHSKSCSHHSHGFKMISSAAACSSIGCIIVCAFFDGIEIFTAFELSSRLGWFIALGLLFHIVPEGAIAAGLSLAGGFTKKSAYRSLLFIAMALFLGVLSGALLSRWVDFDSTLLPLASGILLYVCIGHLMPVALKHRWGIVGILMGSSFIFMLKILMGHQH